MHPKQLKAGSRRDICTPVFTEALFTIMKRRKQPRYPSVDGQLHKVWCMHTIDYYPAFKRKDILTHAATWMKAEDIVLREISSA